MNGGSSGAATGVAASIPKREEDVMRFLMMVKATPESEAGVMPSEKILNAMGAFNEELNKAGVMLDGGGLKPSSTGVRVAYANGKRTVIDGPFTETKELIAGYWLVQVKSRDEAIEWAKRAPMDADGGEWQVEIRQLFELDDFAPGEGIERHRQVQSELARKK